VTIDLGTVSSCAAWMSTRSRQAFHLTWCLLTASILLKGCEHWLVAANQRPAWWLITVIAMAPPTILGVVTHLAVGLGGPDRFGPMTGGPDRTPESAEGQQTRQPALSGGAQLAGGVRRPDQQQDGLRLLAGSTITADVTDGARESSADSTLAIDRPDQRTSPKVTQAGSTTTPDGAEGAGEASEHLALDIDRPGHENRREEVRAGSTFSRRVSAGDEDRNTTHDELEQLIAQGVGRRKLAAQLGISEHQARQLLSARKTSR
jgi:hypothetical protein